MERLTEYDYEQVVLKGLNIVGIGEQNEDILVSGIKKLAAYEDTALTPAEIQKMGINYVSVQEMNSNNIEIANRYLTEANEMISKL